uniref:Uncharacterized protein n=1 Tax=Paracidobacterium acidisoli TaxID=2303751 RepID=A0A372IQG9_9BACT
MQPRIIATRQLKHGLFFCTIEAASAAVAEVYAGHVYGSSRVLYSHTDTQPTLRHTFLCSRPKEIRQ